VAQNSIAKLAVQITTDTSGLDQGFQRARYATEDFDIHTRKLSGGLTRLGSIAIRSSGALGSFGRVAVAGGNLAGPIGLAAVALGTLAGGIAKAADASADFRIEKLREFGLAAPGVKTLADMMGGLREQLGILAELSGLSFKPLVGQLAELSRSFGVLVFGEQAIKNLERQNAEAKGLAEKMKLVKEEEEARNKAAEEAHKKSVAILKQGEQVAKSLRKPDEIFKDTISELKSLSEAGAITGEILSRGINKAAKEYQDTIGKVKELRREIQLTPALEAGTSAFRTAFLSSQSSGGVSAESVRIEREQLAVQKELKAIMAGVLGKREVTFVKGSL
jgi:hypothetical protein